MEKKKIRNILIDILAAALSERGDNGAILERLTPEAFEPLYHLAKKHDLAHIVSAFIYNNEVEVPPEIAAKFKKQEFVSVYRYEQLKYAFSEICGILNAAGIHYIPLKGSVIRPYYPYESMRTSCDVDILIHEEDLDTAISALESGGYVCGKHDYHDVSLYSPNKIHLELHFNILENIKKLDSVLKEAWNYAELTEDCRFDFVREFFIFHIFAHMSYHFVSGGCGIRTLMDIWVMEHKMGITYQCAKELLERADIYKFAAEMTDLADKCFGEGELDEFSELVLDYILSGGVYGSEENHIAVRKSGAGSTFTYAIKRLFLPYSLMKTAYPILKKVPVLLPFCWVARWISAIFGGKAKKIANELKYADNMSADKLDELKEIRSRLGV